MGVPNASANSVRAGVSQDVLDTFWDLSEAKDEIRINAAERLVVLLSEHTSYKGEGKLPQDLDYVVKRLVRGLTSSRKFARPGFAMALTEVIHHFSIGADYIVELIRDLLKVSKKDSKREQGHARLAQALGYLAIMQGGQIPKTSGKTLTIVAESLSKLRSEKHYLHLLGLHALCTLIKSTKPKRFRKFVVPIVSADLEAGWESSSADSLLLLITVRQHHQKAITDDQLQKHWGSASILSATTIPHIAHLLAQTVTCHPQVHPLCTEVVTMAIKELAGKVFGHFWKHVITEKLIQAEQANKRYLAFQLVAHALTLSPTIDKVNHIMSTALVHLLLRCIVHKNDVLCNAGRQLLSKIVDFCSSEAQGDVQLAILRPLLKPPSSIMFDCISQTRTIATIVHNLTADACIDYTRELMKVVLKEGDFCSGKDEMSVCKWAGSQLVAVLSVPSVNSNVQWQSSVVQFLILHCFFKLGKPILTLEHCDRGSCLESERSKALRETFFKALSTLASCHPDKKHSKHEYVTILYNVMHYANQLLLKSSAEVQMVTPLTEEVKALWSKTLTSVEELRKQIASSTSESMSSKSRAFQLLFMLFGLHLFMPESKEAIETIQELEICYSKSKKASKTKTPDEPEWIEVVTELLISFMSKSSHLLRSVSSSAFAFLQPFMTKKALDIVLEVFEASGNGEEEAVAFEEDGEDEGSFSPENVANSSNSFGDEEEEEEEEEDDDDDDDERSIDESTDEEDVDPTLRSAVKSALGKAAVVDDEAGDVEEEADMSDSDMFRLDDALAAAFRGMKRHGSTEKERNKQLLHFKLRCLDLVDQLVKEGAGTDLMLELLVPLVMLIEAGAKDKEQKILGDKAANLYHTLCKLKKIKSSPGEAKSHLSEKLKEMIELSTRVSGVPLALEVGSGCNFLLRAASACEDGAASTSNQSVLGAGRTADALVEIVKDALNEFLTHRESRLSHFIFQHMFERHPEMFWPLHHLLIQCASSSDVRIFCRTQAWSLLSLLLHRNVVSTIGSSEWTAFVTRMQEVVAKIVTEVSDAKNFKPRYVQEFLNVLVRAHAAHPTSTFNILKLEEVKHLFTKPIKKLYAKFRASSIDSGSGARNSALIYDKRTAASRNGGDTNSNGDGADLEPPMSKKQRK